MKFSDYKVEGWNGSVKNTLSFPGFKVLLLELELLENPPKEGRRNLLAVDEHAEIIWIADLPSERILYGFFDVIKERDEKMFLAWCGSFYCEIEAKTGKILHVEFVK